MAKLLSQQDMVNQAWQYFLVEGHPAGILESGRCFYAGPCAVGIFLTPEQRDHFDQDEVQAEDIPNMDLDLFDDTVSRTFLDAFQAAHDRAAYSGTVFEPSKPHPPEVFHETSREKLLMLIRVWRLEIPHA